MTTSTKPAAGRVAISFEFFPPRTEAGREKLRRTAAELAAHRPEFFSLTFGAGGSGRDFSVDTALELQRLAQKLSPPVAVAPHISCVGSDRDNIARMLDAYKNAAIRRLVVIRGDTPSGMVDIGEFHYADELVRFIRGHSGEHFHIEVAAYPEAHPQSKGPAADLARFKNKTEAGANAAITQYFFNADAYFDFINRAAAAGVDIPICPGIMPITNYEQLARFSSVCGAEIPRWLRGRLRDFADDLDSLRAFGVDFIARLCDTLLSQGAPGLHFYTLNNAAPAAAVLRAMDMTDDAAIAPVAAE